MGVVGLGLGTQYQCKVTLFTIMIHYTLAGIRERLEFSVESWYIAPRPYTTLCQDEMNGPLPPPGQQIEMCLNSSQQKQVTERALPRATLYYNSLLWYSPEKIGNTELLVPVLTVIE